MWEGWKLQTGNHCLEILNSELILLQTGCVTLVISLCVQALVFPNVEEEHSLQGQQSFLPHA